MKRIFFCLCFLIFTFLGGDVYADVYTRKVFSFLPWTQNEINYSISKSVDDDGKVTEINVFGSFIVSGLDDSVFMLCADGFDRNVWKFSKTGALLWNTGNLRMSCKMGSTQLGLVDQMGDCYFASVLDGVIAKLNSDDGRILQCEKFDSEIDVIKKMKSIGTLGYFFGSSSKVSFDGISRKAMYHDAVAKSKFELKPSENEKENIAYVRVLSETEDGIWVYIANEISEGVMSSHFVDKYTKNGELLFRIRLDFDSAFYFNYEESYQTIVVTKNNEVMQSVASKDGLYIYKWIKQ